MKEDDNDMETDLEGFYYHTAASRIMYSLAVSLNKDCLEYLWLAILGHTDLFLHGRISDARYSEEVTQLFKDDVARFSAHDTLNRNPLFDGTVHFEPDYKLMLYRHWNLYDSLYHSKYVASRLGTWKSNGIRKLHNLLVNLGIPLQECKEQWCYMKPEIKQILHSKFESVAAEFGLENITFPSFRKVFFFLLFLG